MVMRGPGQFGIEEVPKPVCGDREVLVQVKAVAICGSDPVLLAGGSLSEGLPGSLPHIAGHEGAGIIVQCGKDVRGFAVGTGWRWNPIWAAATAKTARPDGTICAATSAMYPLVTSNTASPSPAASQSTAFTGRRSCTKSLIISATITAR